MSIAASMKKIFLVATLVALLAGLAQGQEWVSTNGPGGGFNSIVFNSKKNMFVAAGSLLRSTDGGKSWKLIAPFDALHGTSWKIAIAPDEDIYITGKSVD